MRIHNRIHHMPALDSLLTLHYFLPSEQLNLLNKNGISSTKSSISLTMNLSLPIIANYMTVQRSFHFIPYADVRVIFLWWMSFLCDKMPKSSIRSGKWFATRQSDPWCSNWQCLHHMAVICLFTAMNKWPYARNITSSLINTTILPITAFCSHCYCNRQWLDYDFSFNHPTVGSVLKCCVLVSSLQIHKIQLLLIQASYILPTLWP